MPDLDPIDVRLGARVRVIREAKHMTQAQLASAIGVTFQQVQKYERGVNRVAVARLIKMAEALETTPTDLIGDGPAGVHPGTDRLVQCWSRISDPKQRQAVLTLVASMSDAAPRA